MIFAPNIKRSSTARRYALQVSVIWTLFMTGSISLSIKRTTDNTLETARIQARSVFEKDICYRRWNALHGGVYVPVNKNTQPNPYLNSPERDIVTPSGKSLTLINPAYMTRQVHELGRKEYGVIGHITSLNPIRPENVADKWETRALQAFERGASEVSSIEKMPNGQYLRLMRQLVTEKGCLPCHEVQGYKEGDIRGGISVAIPMKPLWAIKNKQLFLRILCHVVVWLSGIAVFFFGARKLASGVIERNILEEEVLARKKAEEDCRLSMLQWQATFDAVNDAICLLGPDQRILQCNQTMVNLAGRSSEALIGRFCWEVMHGTTKPIPECPVARMRSSLKREEMELALDDKWFYVTVDPQVDETGTLQGIVHIVRDITDRKQMESEKEKLITELRSTLLKVNTLSGLLPICASCKKIRDDKGYWSQIEAYIKDHSEADFTHSICPECAKKLYSEDYEDV